MATCPKGHPVRDDAVYCGECGAAIVKDSSPVDLPFPLGEQSEAVASTGESPSGLDTCSNGHPNRAGAIFCRTCGEAIARDSSPVDQPPQPDEPYEAVASTGETPSGPDACPNGHANRTGATFCRTCGEAIARDPSPVDQPAPERDEPSEAVASTGETTGRATSSSSGDASFEHEVTAPSEGSWPSPAVTVPPIAPAVEVVAAPMVANQRDDTHVASTDRVPVTGSSADGRSGSKRSLLLIGGVAVAVILAVIVATVSTRHPQSTVNTTTTIVAGSQQVNGGPSAVSWNGATQIDPGVDLSAISCSSMSFCVAIDQNGDAFIFDGSSWSAARCHRPWCKTDLDLVSDIHVLRRPGYQRHRADLRRCGVVKYPVH